jgi:hypothetical protein
MKTQTEINQAKERMLATEKLISKLIDQNVSLLEEQSIEFGEILDQYERDLEVYDDLTCEMKTEEEKKSVKLAPTTNTDSAVNTLKQLAVTVNTFKQLVVTVNTFKQSTAIAKIIAVKNLVSVITTKTTKAKKPN